MSLARSMILSAAIRRALPPIMELRAAYVPRPNGTLSVSPWTNRMVSKGTPSHSETICANVVSWPCPWLNVPATIVTVPPGSKRSSIRSLKTPPCSMK